MGTPNLKYEAGVDPRLWRGGLDLSSTLGRTAAQALNALAQASPQTLSRRQLAEVLYPGQDASSSQAALRQLIVRLKSMLGPDALEVDGRSIRLNPEAWELVLPEQRILDVNHGAELAERFADLVLDVAQMDKAEARLLLASQFFMARCLSTSRMLQVLGAVHPASSSEPFWGEVRNIQCMVLALSGSPLDPLIESVKKTQRTAQKQRNGAVLHRAHALETFFRAGSGRYEGSVVLKPLRPGPAGFYDGLAQASLLWNDNQIEESLRLMESLEPRIEGQSDTVKLHYWCNLTVFAAFPAGLSVAEEAIRRAEAMPGFAIDATTQRCIALAKGRAAALAGDASTALAYTNKYQAISDRFGWSHWDEYEVRADVAMLAGDVGAARRAVAAWEFKLNRSGMGQNRRTNSRMRQIRAKLA